MKLTNLYIDKWGCDFKITRPREHFERLLITPNTCLEKACTWLSCESLVSLEMTINKREILVKDTFVIMEIV